ncbi:conserved protein of unknown function [Pararobbsia alpina]|jgi:hypothetical protein|uniref:hypothetical protein n=1 Tax=Pararobbsia alpina TaxID=621374 RepID=UPI0039A4DBB7
MYLVYWSETAGDARTPHAREFPADELAQALRFAEALRQRQHEGEPVGFVTLCSENPNAVGRAGVSEPPADYAWKKRRS